MSGNIGLRPNVRWRPPRIYVYIQNMEDLPSFFELELRKNFNWTKNLSSQIANASMRVPFCSHIHITFSHSKFSNTSNNTLVSALDNPL